MKIFVVATTLFSFVFCNIGITEKTMEVRRLSACSANIGEKVLDLSSSRINATARFYSELNNISYWFNPCQAYSIPSNPHDGLGDQCHEVALCKSQYIDGERYYYSMGTLLSAKFQQLENITEIIFRGLRTYQQHYSHILCVCSQEAPSFTVINDTKESYNSYFQLSHKCCCLNGCIINKEMSDEKKFFLILVFINVGIVFIAIMIAGRCYKATASATSFYNALPGIHSSMTNQNSCKHLHVTTIQPPNLYSVSMNYQDITIKERLGGGLFGDTYKAVWRATPVAVKRIMVGIHNNQLTDNERYSVRKEIIRLSCQRHQSIVSVFGVYFEEKYPYIVSELVDGPSICDYLVNNIETLTWTQRIKICRQLSDAMVYLHNNNTPPLLHRNLRCSNILMVGEDKIKVVDFGITKLVQDLRKECTSETNCLCQKQLSACPESIRWTAPEILSQPSAEEGDTSVFTTQCDVYSFAIVLWELLEAETPFSDMKNEEQVMLAVKAGLRPIVPKIPVMKEYVNLMKACWDEDPKSRPCFREVTTELKGMLLTSRAFQKMLSRMPSRKVT